jgi:hypothetical protein
MLTVNLMVSGDEKQLKAFIPTPQSFSYSFITHSSLKSRDDL